MAGAGGVLLNVQLTKMVTDWFAGKEIATAMAVFVNSWPAGIALSLLILPSIGTAHGVQAVHLFVVALTVIGIALTLTYRPPPDEAATATASARLDLKAMIAVTVAALIWGLFNVGFAVIFSFGPTLLVERGWTHRTSRLRRQHRAVAVGVQRALRRLSRRPPEAPADACWSWARSPSPP